MGSRVPRSLLFGTVAALVAAAVLVLYLQQRSREDQRRQTALILQQVCDGTAPVLAGRVRQLLDGAAQDTLEGIGHPEIKADDLPRLASFFSTGLERYPYVDRFFYWNALLPGADPEEVRFFSTAGVAGPGVTQIHGPNGAALGALVADPVFGRSIMNLAREAAVQRRSFAIVEATIDGRPWQVIVHLLFDDERRATFFAVIGYLVDLRSAGADLFRRVGEDELRNAVNTNPRSPRLALTVFDDSRRRVWGPPVLAGVPFATAPLDMIFFPGEAFRSFLSMRPPTRNWYVTVSVAEPVESGEGNALLPSAAAVLLIMIALLCAIMIDHETTALARMQAEFVAHVSHELKTPLSLLSAAAETLRLERVSSPDKVREYLGIVGTQSARLSSLLDKILQFSRLDSRERVEEFETIEVTALAEQTVKAFEAALPSGGTIHLRAPADPVWLRACPGAFEDILSTLLENAIKYDSSHRIDVSIVADGAQLTLAVRDAGVGISPEDLPHVFDRFYRGRNNTRHRRGFGLGLAIVRTLVRRHGGTVSVRSQVGEGAEFVVKLPVIRRANEHAA